MINKLKNKTYAFSAILLLTVVFIALYFVLNDEPEYAVERVLKYSFTVTNPTNNLVEQSNLWVYVPVLRTSAQKFISVDASQGYRLVSDELGNQRLFFELQNIAPYGSQVVTIKVHVNMSGKPNRIDLENAELFLKNEKYIESDNVSIKGLAADLRDSDETKTAEKIYSWVLENIEYKGFISEDRGALFALNNTYGDCTEYAYLVTALARANKLPSRSVAGFVYSENARLLVKDYHNWSEVLLGNTWQLVDAQKQVFMQQSEDYVAMRIMSVDESGRSENSQKFFHVEAPLVAVMN